MVYLIRVDNLLGYTDKNYILIQFALIFFLSLGVALINITAVLIILAKLATISSF